MKTLAAVAACALALTACGSPAENAAPAEVVTVTVTEKVTEVVTETVEVEAEPEVAPATYTPRKRDFELSLTTLEKECFGSAGCIVEVRVELAYGGRDLDPAETYELTYEVSGGEDPIIDTIDFIGDEYEVSEHRVSTESKDAELGVKVTSVRNRGF